MAEEEQVEPPKPSKLGGILTIVNLAVTGLIAFKVMTFKPVAPAPVTAAAAPVVDEDFDPDAPGPIQQFEEPFVVNLNEPRGGRFLKMKVAFELSHPKYVEEFEKAQRLVRDEMLRYLSSLTVAETMGEEAKMDIQKSIVARVDNILGGREGRPRVQRVYFEEFVVQ